MLLITELTSHNVYIFLLSTVSDTSSYRTFGPTQNVNLFIFQILQAKIRHLEQLIYMRDLKLEDLEERASDLQYQKMPFRSRRRHSDKTYDYF